MTKQWFDNGFTMILTEIIEKPLVLQAKRLNTIETTIGFIVKPVPATASNQQPATIHGSGVRFALTRWIHYEEPLQPSCLGNKSTS